MLLSRNAGADRTTAPGSVAAEVDTMASLRQRPAEALLEQSSTLLAALHGLRDEPEPLSGPASRLLASHRALLASLRTPAVERPLPLPEAACGAPRPGRRAWRRL